MGLTLLNLSEAGRAARLAAVNDEAKLASEALSPMLYQLSNADLEDPKFQRITSRAVLRDLNPMMHERMQQVCFFLAVTTPFGKRIVQIMTDYVVGEGFKAIAEDTAVQAVIERFWHDDVNDLPQNIEAWFKEQLTFGELCLPVAVNPVDGFVRIGYIDPQEIGAVEFGGLTTSGDTPEITVPIAVHLKRKIGEDAGRVLKIIRVDEDVNSPTFGQLDGDCFYFAINKAKSATRGISDLFCLADWIDVFDQMTFDFADRVRFLNSFVWHYVLKGADQKAVDDFKKTVTRNPPKQGGVQVTNDQVTIEARTPTLQGADMSHASDVVKKYGLGGAGLPLWFFADPVDANRSTAQEMEGPTGKMLTNKQNHLKRIITALVTFAIAKAAQHGVLTKKANHAFKLIVPDLSIKDMTKAAGTLQILANALVMGRDAGWIRAETAAQSYHLMMMQLGVDIDSKTEFKLAQKEVLDATARAIDALQPQGTLAGHLGGAAGISRSDIKN